MHSRTYLYEYIGAHAGRCLNGTACKKSDILKKHKIWRFLICRGVYQHCLAPSPVPCNLLAAVYPARLGPRKHSMNQLKTESTCSKVYWGRRQRQERFHGRSVLGNAHYHGLSQFLPTSACLAVSVRTQNIFSRFRPKKTDLIKLRICTNLGPCPLTRSIF